MQAITRGVAGAALDVGVLLAGGVPANAADGVTVIEQDNACRTKLATKDLWDGKFQHQLTLACDRLEPGYEARAVVTVRGSDGSPARKWVTPWLDTAPGSVQTTLTLHRGVTDVRVHYRRIEE